MSLFFNADFEDYLASQENEYRIVSNKRNQELEYFILWLESESLYSSKKYDKKYIEFIESIKKEPIKVEETKNNIKTWCSAVENKSHLIKLNSKLTSAEFAIKTHMVPPQVEIIEQVKEIHPDWLYKDPLGVSGISTWRGDLHRELILKRIKETKLITEPLLKRTFDFSTCVTENEDFIYQNHVDEYFQYKGSTLGINFKSMFWYDEYIKNISLIKKYYFDLGITYPYSIDSFLYKENNIEKLYTLSEVNARKTMGFVAISLWKRYFQEFRYCGFRIFNSKKIKFSIDHQKLYKVFDKKVISLSPSGNIFSIFLFAADSIHDLYEIEDHLFATLLEGI